MRTYICKHRHTHIHIHGNIHDTHVLFYNRYHVPRQNIDCVSYTYYYLHGRSYTQALDPQHDIGQQFCVNWDMLIKKNMYTHSVKTVHKLFFRLYTDTDVHTLAQFQMLLSHLVRHQRWDFYNCGPSGGMRQMVVESTSGTFSGLPNSKTVSRCFISKK